MIRIDAPILDADGDKLGRAAFAEKLARYIEDLPPKPTTVIGLHGSWGSGKTSLLNMTKGMIDSDRIEAIWFNPWNQIGDTSIIDELFSQIKEAFAIRTDGSLQVRIADAIDDYSTAVASAVQVGSTAMGAPIPQSAIKAPAKGIARRVRACGKKRLGSISSLKECASAALSESNKRVLVIIDDIDRLSDEKIRLVFQMVAAIANFPQVHYLLSFDWAIAARALDAIQVGKGEAYLEKIVQVPLRVPEISDGQVADLLESEAVDMIAGGPANAITLAQYADRARTAMREHVLPFASTLRDVKRYLNVLDFELKCSSAAIDPVDIACMASLKAFLPSAFEWVLANEGLMLNSAHNNLRDALQNTDDRRTEARADIVHTCAVDDTRAEEIIRLLADVFPAFGYRVGLRGDSGDMAVLRAKRRIADAGLFELYRNGLLEADNFPSDEIHEAAYLLAVPDLTAKFREKLALHSDTLAFGLCGHLNELPVERVNVVLLALMGAFDALPEDHAVDEGTWTYELLERSLTLAGKAAAADAVIRCLPTFNLEGLLVFAHLLYGQCWAFGDFGESGVSVRGHLLTEEAFRSIVSRYIEAVERWTAGVNVFERHHPRTALLIWMRYDESGCRDYLNALFEDAYNAMSCLMLSATPSSFDSSVPFWRIDWQFKRFMSVVDAKERLAEFVASSRFREMECRSQQALVAMNLAIAEYGRTEVETDVIKHALVEDALANWAETW